MKPDPKALATDFSMFRFLVAATVITASVFPIVLQETASFVDIPTAIASLV